MELPFYSDSQNLPENIDLLKASIVSYNSAKSNEYTFSYFFLILSILYPVAYVFWNDENVLHGLFAISLCLTVLYQLFYNWIKGNTTMGALLKEEFDLKILGLPVKFMFADLETVNVNRLAEKYKGNEIKDWYSPNISGSIPKNTTIAVCQRVNCKWDGDLRKEFRFLLYIIVISHFISILFLGFLIIQNFLTSFLLLFSLTPFYIHFITLIRSNTSAIIKREKIRTKLDLYINHNKNLTIENLRDVQDEILNIRQEASKVPDFFFRKLNSKFQQDHEKYISRINKIYKK